MHRGCLVEPQAKISSGCQSFARCGSRSCRCQRTLYANALRCLTACRQRKKTRTVRSPKLITGRLWDAHLRERTIASRCRSRPAAVVAHHPKRQRRLTASRIARIVALAARAVPGPPSKASALMSAQDLLDLGAIPFAAPASDRSKPRAKREMRTRSLRQGRGPQPIRAASPGHANCRPPPRL